MKLATGVVVKKLFGMVDAQVSKPESKLEAIHP
jgi:hypothetical protein